MIAVPLISSDTEEKTSSSKLILPQDRYCKANLSSDEKSEEQSSKFNRYNDKSESESESEDEETSEGSPKKLERANSLEALMQELENEIEGKSNVNVEEKVKVKVKKPKKKVEEVQHKPVVETKQAVDEIKQMKPVETTKQKSYNINQGGKFENQLSAPLPPAVVTVPAYAPQTPYYQPPVIPQYNPVPVILPHYEPPRFERIPSPLSIDTDLLNTTVTAPLSPRSAAFVMQNREIIERRKRQSPSRRSYSRSPSTPRYNRNRSRTKSRSPKARPTTPSPRKRTPPEKKASVYERLGTRVGKLDSCSCCSAPKF